LPLFQSRNKKHQSEKERPLARVLLRLTGKSDAGVVFISSPGKQTGSSDSDLQSDFVIEAVRPREKEIELLKWNRFRIDDALHLI
jgi:hypothetical protein